MNGKELFEKYIKDGGEYAQTVMGALYADPENVFTLLEEAERTNRVLALDYPIDPDDGPSDPFITLVDKK